MKADIGDTVSVLLDEGYIVTGKVTEIGRMRGNLYVVPGANKSAGWWVWPEQVRAVEKAKKGKR